MATPFASLERNHMAVSSLAYGEGSSAPRDNAGAKTMAVPNRVQRLHRWDDRRDRLRQIITNESLRRGESFTLASGRPSTFFFDMKKTMLHPEGCSLLADVLFEMIKEDRDVDYIGGLEVGAIPIVTAVAARSWPERPVWPAPGFVDTRLR